jgi:hypothetical protein
MTLQPFFHPQPPSEKRERTKKHCHKSFERQPPLEAERRLYPFFFSLAVLENFSENRPEARTIDSKDSV